MDKYKTNFNNFKLLSFIIFIFLIINSFYNKFYLNEKVNLSNQKIKNFENKLKKISEREFQDFRKINSENILNRKIKNLYDRKTPDISVIVTSYNQAHCIHKCIRSIQNQSINNIEILIIDDCSTDNSTNIIEEYQLYDKRIILVKHDSNEGTIKTRTDGIKLAKGKYIIIIDGDDALIHKNVLYNGLFVANIGNLDVVEFKLCYYRKGSCKQVLNTYDLINITGIIYQPELRTKFFVLSDNHSIRAIQSRSIAGKLIRNEVFQQAIINIGPKYTDSWICSYEDTIMSVAVCQIAKSYYLMKEIGYYYSKNEEDGVNSSFKKYKKCKPNQKKKLEGQIKLLQFLIEKTANNKLERQMIYYEIMSIDYYLKFIKVINKNYQSVYELLDPMIKSPFLTNSQKEDLIIMRNNLMKKQNKTL